MEFLNAGMLAGGLLIGAPILIHLINQQRYRKVEWAAMRFLKEAVRRTHKRLQLEHILLLLLRIAMILLIVMAVSRPFVSSIAGIKLEQNQHYAILVLDQSYSMGYNTGGGSLFDKAKDAARKIMDMMKSGDRISVVLMSDHPTAPVGDPSAMLDEARKILMNLKVSDFSGGVGKTLGVVKGMVDQSPLKAIRIYVITDFQKHGWLDRQGQLDPAIARDLSRIADKAGIVIVDVGPKEVTNFAVKDLTTSFPVVTKEVPFHLVADVMGMGTIPNAQTTVALVVDENRQATKTIALKPGETQRVEFLATLHTGGAHTAAVEVEADPLMADNTRFITLNVQDSIDVLCVDGDPGASKRQSETLFLRTALNPRGSSNGSAPITVVQPKVIPVSELTTTDLSRYKAIILANVASLNQEWVTQRLEKAVQQGTGLILFLGGRVDAANYNQVLYRSGQGVLPAKLTTVGGDREHKKYVRMKMEATDHPLLRWFAESRIPASPFLVFEYFNVAQEKNDRAVQIVGRYNTSEGAPAIMTKKFGRGDVVLVTTSAGQGWNLMGLDASYFVPMVQDLVRYVTSGFAVSTNGEVGDEFSYALAQEWYGKEIYLRTPTRERIPQPAIQKDGQVRVSFSETFKSGLYALEAGATVVSQFAVNVDPAESDLSRWGKDDLATLFPNVKIQYAEGVGALFTSQEKSVGKELWSSCLILLFAVMFVEMFLAQRFGTYKNSDQSSVNSDQLTRTHQQ